MSLVEVEQLQAAITELEDKLNNNQTLISNKVPHALNTSTSLSSTALVTTSILFSLHIPQWLHERQFIFENLDVLPFSWREHTWPQFTQSFGCCAKVRPNACPATNTMLGHTAWQTLKPQRKTGGVCQNDFAVAAVEMQVVR